MNAQRNILF